jgi:hypothetical protein
MAQSWNWQFEIEPAASAPSPDLLILTSGTSKPLDEVVGCSADVGTILVWVGEGARANASAAARANQLLSNSQHQNLEQIYESLQQLYQAVEPPSAVLIISRLDDQLCFSGSGFTLANQAGTSSIEVDSGVVDMRLRAWSTMEPLRIHVFAQDNSHRIVAKLSRAESDDVIPELTEDFKQSGQAGSLTSKFFRWSALVATRTVAFLSWLRALPAVAVGVSIAGLVILAFVYWWWVQWSPQAQQREALESELAELAISRQEILELSQSDVQAARAAAATVLVELAKLKDLYPERTHALIDQERRVVSELAETLSGREVLDELDLFFDLRTVQSSFIASKVAFDSTNAYFVDAERKELIVVALATAQSVGLFSLASIETDIRSIAVANDTLFLLADGVFAVPIAVLESDAQGKVSPQRVIPEGDSNRQATIIAAYERFVYVINPTRRNIFRYTEQSQNQYSQPIGWLTGAFGVELPGVTTLTIDGDIWFGTEAGDVVRLQSGGRVPFEPSVIEPVIESPILIASVGESNELFILEPRQARLIKMNKNGDFLTQQTHPTLASAVAVGIVPDKNTALVVSGSLIYRLTF